MSEVNEVPSYNKQIDDPYKAYTRSSPTYLEQMSEWRSWMENREKEWREAAKLEEGKDPTVMIVSDGFRRIKDAIRLAESRYTNVNYYSALDELATIERDMIYVKDEIPKKGKSQKEYMAECEEAIADLKDKRDAVYEKIEEFLQPSFTVKGKRYYLSDLNAL